MITTKSLRRPRFTHNWTAPKPKVIVQAIALTALAAASYPSLSNVINHQLSLQAANGRTCFRVAPDRKSQVRKYGADCDL